jgi:carbon storage regulator
MLVLTRRRGESIVIDAGDGIEITVIEAGNGSVRLGIEAPKSVDIWRKEVLQQIREYNIKAAETADRELEGLQNLLKRREKKSG